MSYQFINNEKYDNFLDIGANYGLISILARLHSKDINIITVEADPRLIPLIKDNFRLNGLTSPTIINSIVGNTNQNGFSFSLNPRSTLDNRVQMSSWEKVNVPMRTGQSLLTEHQISGKTFIKIDTQGYEMNILIGMKEYLKTSTDWMIKMEFAPDWLISQGTDPLRLLSYICCNYQFAEFPERIQFNTTKLDDLFSKCIYNIDLDSFLKYVISLNKHQLGWVDLIIRPKQAK